MAGGCRAQNKSGIRWDFAPASHALTSCLERRGRRSTQLSGRARFCYTIREITSPKGKRMADTRLNGIIRALESGRPAFTCFSPPEVDSAYAISVSKYDGVVWEMEHNPWDS